MVPKNKKGIGLKPEQSGSSEWAWAAERENQGIGCSRLVLPSWPAKQPGLNFLVKGIQFRRSSTGRECVAQLYTHRPTDWDVGPSPGTESGSVAWDIESDQGVRRRRCDSSVTTSNAEMVR